VLQPCDMAKDRVDEAKSFTRTGSLLESRGGCSLEYATQTESYNDLKKNLDKALGEPELYMRVFASVVIDQ
jgi:hypothetical protein